MADPTLASMLPRITPYLTGSCPDIVQVQQLRSAYANFCRHSDAYVYEPAAVDTVADTSSYDFTLPDNTMVLRVKWLKLDDGDELDSSLYSVDTDGGITFETAPTSDGVEITAKLILCPTVSASTMPDWMYERWGEAICHGAIAYLKMIQKKPWTDMQGAAIYQDLYREGLGMAKSETLTERKHGGIVFTPPDWV